MPELRILHLSDTHLLADGALHYGSVDTTAALDAVLTAAARIARLDVVVASGDLSDDGSPTSYRLVRDRLEPWAAARGARVVYAMGNHDDRSGFAAVLGDGHGGAGPIGGPIGGVSEIAGHRVVTLDSTVPGAGYGHLDAGQLARLRALLATPGPHGTVVVLHHPPVPAVTPLLRALELQNPGDLADAVAGSDVRLILAGHYHHLLVDRLAGVPVVVAPGIANTTDTCAPEGMERAHVGAAALVIELGAAGPRLHTVPARMADDGREVFTLDADEVARIATIAGPRGGGSGI